MSRHAGSVRRLTPVSRRPSTKPRGKTTGTKRRRRARRSQPWNKGPQGYRYRGRGPRSQESKKKRNKANSERGYAHPEMVYRRVSSYTALDCKMIPPPKEEMVITESRVLTNAKNHTVVHFLKNCLPYHLCNTLFHSIEELQSSDLRPDHDKSRKIDKLYHFGHWRFYTKDIREAKKTAMAPAREWIATNGPLFDHLAGLLTKFYPHLRED